VLYLHVFPGIDYLMDVLVYCFYTFLMQLNCISIACQVDV
jgi:hypothetical protein